MLQILISFPQIIFSSVKTEETNNHIFEHFGNVDKISEIQFLDQNIPSFSNNKVSKTTAGFRWIGNLMLQPIDLFQNNTKDEIFRWGPIRWFTSAGVIEEQGKVAYFVSCELRNFLYDNVVPALVNNERIVDDEYIRRFFYLLYKQIGRNEREELRLKEIYITLTGKENVDFENIVSDEEKRQISRYQMWSGATYLVGALALIPEYLCFAFRNQGMSWYKDPVFHFATLVKFMRLGSLVASKYPADSMTEYFTGNKLTNNIYFQDFFYNDFARMVMAIVPLVMFESTNNIKILSIATAVDVLTTVRSDMNSGKAISMVGKLSTEKLTTKLQCAQGNGGVSGNQGGSTSQLNANDDGEIERPVSVVDVTHKTIDDNNGAASLANDFAYLNLGNNEISDEGEEALKNQNMAGEMGAQFNDQPGPSGKLSEVLPISHSRSLSSLHSNGSDIGVN